MPVARTIQIFLPEGEPRGIRIAGFSNRVVQAMAFPRSKFAEATKRPELSKVGIYFLFGQREGDERPNVYIGRAECCSDRLTTHNADTEMEFWHTGVVVVSGSQSFTAGHVTMLEHDSIRKAREAGRYQVENADSGSKPHLTEAMAAEVDEVLVDLEVLLGSLGFAVFDPVASLASRGGSPTGGLHLFSLTRKGYAARLIYNEDGFVVLKGSEARPDVVASAKDLEPDRERLVKQDVMEKRPDKYVFLRDHAFSAPSSAAEMICGGAINGWDAWIDDRGRTLHQVYREPKTSGAPKPQVVDTRLKTPTPSPSSAATRSPGPGATSCAPTDKS